MSKIDIVKRALKRLVLIKAISKYWSSVKHKLKNSFYRLNTISLNHQWTYTFIKQDEPEELKDDGDSDDPFWKEMEEVIGNL